MHDSINTGEAPGAKQEIHLRDYVAILRKRQPLVLTFFALTLALVTLVTFTMTPLYTASTQVLIEENYGNDNIEGTYTYRRYDQAFLNTQFKIIASSNVIRRVVDRLELDTRYRDYFLDPEKSPAFLKAVLDKFSALFQGVFSGPDPAEIPAEEGDDRVNPVQIVPVSDADLIVEAIKENLRIQPEEETRIVKIMYSHPHPGMARLVVDSLIQAYKDELQEIKHSSSSDTLRWMTEKAEEERRKLEQSERALQAYMRKNDIVTVENKLAIYPQRLSEFSSQLSQIQAERKKLESVYAQIKAARDNEKDLETIPVFADSPVLQTLREKIYAAEQNIKQLSKTYGYKNPVMIKAKGELRSLRQEKKHEVQRIIAATKNAYDLAVSQEENIMELLNTTKKELLDLNEKFVQYSIMQREVNTNSILYDTLTSSLKKAGVTQQSQSVNVWVIKKAFFPREPSHPRKMLNLLLGAVLGLMGGVVFAFFIEYLDNTAKNPDELERRTGLTVLGSIEELEGEDAEIETFIAREPLSPVAESYRLIRSAILLSAVEQPPRVILFTSMVPGEGKSSTTVNMARILAQSGRKVLVVDCDMRRPRQHALFAVPNATGLSSFLSGNTQEDMIQHPAGEDFSLLVAGPTPPNPVELLDSERMKTFLVRLKEKYDFVLLDSPPVQSVTDSLTLSTLVDGTVLVVRAGRTTYDLITHGLRKLKAVNAHLLGVVLNGVKATPGRDGYYGYHKYYNKDSSKAA